MNERKQAEQYNHFPKMRSHQNEHIKIKNFFAMKHDQLKPICGNIKF